MGGRSSSKDCSSNNLCPEALVLFYYNFFPTMFNTCLNKMVKIAGKPMIEYPGRLTFF